jgi:hypothetical protein
MKKINMSLHTSLTIEGSVVVIWILFVNPSCILDFSIAVRGTLHRYTSCSYYDTTPHNTTHHTTHHNTPHNTPHHTTPHHITHHITHHTTQHHTTQHNTTHQHHTTT